MWFNCGCVSRSCDGCSEKKMRIKIYFIVLFGIFLISLVSAVPSPHGFYGTVSNSNGKIIEDGIIIAEINELVVGVGDVINGTYDLTVESEYGGMIYFYFEGKMEPIANYTFDGFEITELNLIIPVLIPKPEEDQESSGHTSNIEQPCEPSWECEKWSSCYNGLIQRKCYDRNQCDYSYNKPNEVTGCEVSGKVFVDKNNYVLFGGILTIVLLGILIGILAKR